MNHFLEIQKGSDGYIWWMIHSGSRNIGKQIADYYLKIAKDIADKSGTGIPQGFQMDGFRTDSEEGQSYLREMNYALNFSFANRKMMSESVQSIFSSILGSVAVEEEINIHHNYASLEEHFGENVWVHRKGATLAEEGTIGIIPGSQGTRSFIVRGLGNPESFNSCSHGAGRALGRNKARKELDLAEQQKLLNDQGILHSIRGTDDLDEAPGAYKNIDEVIEQELDLIEVMVSLQPLAVLKG